MAKPELLFLSHLLPYPPDSGAAIRTFNTVRELARQFSITGLCFYRQDPAAEGLSVAERLDRLAEWGAFRAIPIPQQGNRPRFLLDHVRSLITARPYTWYMHDSPDFLHHLQKLISHPFALVHLDSLDLVRYASMVTGLPVTCTHHNVESSLLRRRAQGTGNPAMRLYLNLQASFLERVEREFLPRMSLNIAVSPADQSELARLSPSAHLAMIPNGVDTEYFGPAKPGGQGLVFVGGTNWFPNRDALDWFVAEVLPILRSGGYHDPVTWVGFSGDEERRRYGAIPGLTLTGYVNDVRPYLAAAAVAIVPLRVGGGTRLKVLDAWSMGKAVVSTSIGCEGLATRPGNNILVADTPQAFTDAVLQVTRDSELQCRLGTEARKTVEHQYAWSVIGEELTSLYSELIERNSSAATLAESSLGHPSEKS